jgi:hypothetical protein
MLIREYRIPMPLSVEEYRIAQLYMVAKFSRERTTKGEGIEILVNEPFENENGKGQYTHKVIHLGSHLPAWLKSFLPVSVTSVEEKAWNAYPYVKTVYTCPFFGDRFSIVSETRYLGDDGTTANVHNLPADQLKVRELDFIDIVTEPVDPRYYKKEEDPTIFISAKTKRGPLDKQWRTTFNPRMCIYKVAFVEFKVWGLQTRVESWLHKSMVRDVVLLGHKQAYCWIDEWCGLTMEDIRKYEDETKVLLDKLRTGLVADGSSATATTTESKVDTEDKKEQKQEIETEKKVESQNIEEMYLE